MTATNIGNLLLLAPKATTVTKQLGDANTISPTGSTTTTTNTTAAHATMQQLEMTLGSATRGLPPPSSLLDRTPTLVSATAAATTTPPSLPSLLSYSDILVRASMAQTLQRHQRQQALLHPPPTAPSLLLRPTNTSNTTLATSSSPTYDPTPGASALHKLRQTQQIHSELQKIKQQQQHEQPPQTICIPKPITATTVTAAPKPPLAQPPVEVIVPVAAAPVVALSPRPRLAIPTAAAPCTAAAALAAPSTLLASNRNHQQQTESSSSSSTHSSSFKRMMMFGNPLSAPPALVKKTSYPSNSNGKTTKKRFFTAPAPISCLLLDAPSQEREPALKKRKVLSPLPTGIVTSEEEEEEEEDVGSAVPLGPPVRHVSSATLAEASAGASDNNNKILTSELLQAAQSLKEISSYPKTVTTIAQPVLLTSKALKPPPSFIGLLQ